MTCKPQINQALCIQRNYSMLATLLTLGLMVAADLKADAGTPLSGREIMDEVYQRHEQFPYVYEEQIMILVDKAGNRDTRKLRRYSRMASRGAGKYLLLFDDPPEVRGVGLLTSRLSAGNAETGIYLPAYGPMLISSIGRNESGNFLGTDFSVNDLLPEVLDDFRYERRDNQQLGKVNFYIIDVYPEQGEEIRLRRHFIRQDNFYITRTDTFDRHGRLHKQQTHHDLKFLGGAMWRANMIRMVDHKAKHQSLIKIARRIFSRDYVPEKMFSLEWLVDNRKMPVKPEAPAEAAPHEAEGKDKTGGSGISYNSQGAS